MHCGDLKQQHLYGKGIATYVVQGVYHLVRTSLCIAIPFIYVVQIYRKLQHLFKDNIYGSVYFVSFVELRM